LEYRKLEHTGLIVSAIALGSIQFGGGMNMGNLDQNDTTEMVRFALGQGINFIDTADVYSRGESESLIGNASRADWCTTRYSRSPATTRTGHHRRTITSVNS
jgi:aryl-alcohol dehydrogenase-like predicted oxidoreductase